MKARKEFIAGIIIIVTLIAFWWLFKFLKAQNIFTNQNTYYIKYNKVEGLSKSKNVNINGLKVGMVESITPVPTKTKNISFIVSINVDKDYKFSKNSVAQIVTSFMNGAEINLVLAEDQAEIAKSGDTLKGSLVPGLMDLAEEKIKPISDNANTVLMRLDSTLASTNKLLNEKNRQNIEASLANLNNAIAEFNKLGKGANQLLATNSSKITTAIDNTNKMLVTTNSTVEKYGMMADKLNKTDLDVAVKKLESTLSNLNDISSKINSGEGTMGKLMNDPGLYSNLTQASKNLSVLLDDLKTHPKRYVHFSIFGGKDKTKKKEEPIN
ncbi:MlaD family protein [Apibacter sp.]|uniref:MlaD family protein n=1 Tax=Apibacter sp. TaxID=2023709 RepID=UPI0025EB3568|nr:MlaD family protein [Apibacter sp.]MCT6869303.1 MlaD family protein [Apibacter sp.]